MTARVSAYQQKLAAFATIAFDGAAVFSHRGRWRDWFGTRIGPAFNGHLIFEVGCFDARYLCRIAAKHPETAFIGLDWKFKALYDGARHVAELGLRNVALLRARGQDVAQIFGERELDELWLFHPDPCDREVELKNRLFAEPFLKDVHRVLRSNESTLCLKTDHPGYYQWVLALLDLPEPKWFAAARSGPNDKTLPRVRARDLVPPAELPARSDEILRRFDVSINAADYWSDPGALSHTSAKLFSGEFTLFERRFVQKRLPIYYVELKKKSAIS